MEEKYMKRAIALAKKGIGAVNPNPLVGAVLVKDGRIIGEGYHEKYGGLHAERNAFAAAAESCKGAELYVTLEPCCHYGKQPPCTDAIIGNGIRRVYVGSDDPNALVAGNGIKKLREAGVEVVSGVLKEECDALNPVFFYYIKEKLPYVVMKYAMTLDGKTAVENGKSRWITGEDARAYVHEMRNALSGIMVGIETVLKDNPMLTCRRTGGGRNPVRIIADTLLRLPEDCAIVESASDITTYVAAGAATLAEKKRTDAAFMEKMIYLQKKGIQILEVEEKEGHLDLRCLMKLLGERGVDGILLEGGGTLNAAMLSAGLVQHMQVYLGSKIFGGKGVHTPVKGTGAASPADAWRAVRPKVKVLGEDVLVEYDIKTVS